MFARPVIAFQVPDVPVCSGKDSASGVAAAIGVTTLQVMGGRPLKSMKPEANLIPKITTGHTKLTS